MKPTPFVPLFTISNALTTSLTDIERARGFLEAATLSEQWVRQMSERALLLEAHHTTHIEGTLLTLEQSERAWNGKSIEHARIDDIRELLNYRAAFHLVSDYLRSGEPITEALIREIHKRLVHGVRGGEARPGTYRTVQNHVVNNKTNKIVYTPPPPEDVPPLMHQLVAWLREPSPIHPVLIAGIAQFQLVHIHPFVDGNGRCSRLLSTLCLYRAGYDFKRLFTLSEYYDRDRAAFYDALQSVRQNKMDLSTWLEYFAKGLSTQLIEIKGRGALAIRHDVLIQEHKLNARQAIAIDYLLREGSIDIQAYSGECGGTSRRTLQRDLSDMEKKGILISEEAGGRRSYRLVQPKSLS